MMTKNLVWFLMASFVPQSVSTCFSTSYLPKALTNSNEINKSAYYAVEATDEALFLGGGTKDSFLR